jgi:WD40 repeat protein
VDADLNVSLWDPSNGHRVGQPLELEDASGSSRGKRAALAWQGNDKLLAAKSWAVSRSDGDYVISLCNVQGRHTLGEPLRAHKEQVTSLAFSKDAKTLASGDSAGKIRVWDLATRKSSALTCEDLTTVVDLAFQGSGKVLVSGHEDGRVVFWDLVHGQPLRSIINFHQSIIHKLAFNTTGSIMASTTGNQTFLWDVVLRRPLGRLPHDRFYGDLAFSPDGKNLLMSDSGAKRLIVWDVGMASWRDRVCGIASRNLTRTEWHTYMGKGVPFRQTWPNLPGPEEKQEAKEK